ncbi:MAG: ATP-dependent DNA helicase [Erysipelotrichales bacterium]|nr:ATP-dependent DNA helicase [Erysipelotrichales bacterium]
MFKEKDTAFDWFHNEPKPVDIMDFFVNILPSEGKPLRRSQLEMSLEIQNALSKRKKFIAEAEVGTGKSFAYIIPAYNHYIKRTSLTQKRKPILISTSTIVLQEQLIEKDLKYIKGILLKRDYVNKSDFDYCLLKGKENFLCEDRLVKVSTKKYLAQMIDQISEDYYSKHCIDRNDFSYVDDIVWKMINVKTCSNRCECIDDCKYKEYRLKMRNSDYMFYVCNHHYLLSLLKNDKICLEEEYSAIIIDEAHNLENAAFSILGDHKSIYSFISIIERMRRKVSRGVYLSKRRLARLSKIEGMIANFFDSINSFLIKENEKIEYDIRYKLHNSSVIENLAFSLKCEINDFYSNEITTIIDISSNKYGKSKDDDELENEVNNLIRFLNAITDSDNNVYWVQFIKQKKDDTLQVYFIPKNIDEILLNELFNKDIPIVLTSATLSDISAEEYGFDYFQNCIGLSRIRNIDYQPPISKKSSFNYKENCVIYFENVIKHRQITDSNYYEYLDSKADKIYNIITITHGRSLILFTSHDTLNYTVKRIKEKIEKDLAIKCFVQGEKSIKDLYISFREDINSCLFATGSFWEGIDIPGESLSCVIIDKLPFPVKDIVIELKTEKLQYESSFDILQPEMIIKLRQGVGRLIRSVNDVGAVAILDSRASDKYYKIIKASLPECKEVDSINEIGKFSKIY